MRFALIAAAAVLCTGPAWAKAKPQPPAPQPVPWMNVALSPDDRAALLVQQMTEDEKLTLVRGYFGVPAGPFAAGMPKGAIGSAGFVPGIPRLGVPALQESDASLGIANPFNVRPGDVATALPSSLATAASFDPTVAYAGGAMIGQEAWRKGFNVLLAGGVDLARDPRNGRNFEYAGEDPLLAGTIAGEAIRGIQDQHVISTAKHFALNDQETGRGILNAAIDEAGMRESDLLAFEVAIGKGHPGSVMCSYNRLNGVYACGNAHLLNDVLKTDWHYPGFVMSDWGAVHDVSYAANGLDQESGSQLDSPRAMAALTGADPASLPAGGPPFAEPLKAAVDAGTIPPARLTDMAERILRSMFAAGLFDSPPAKSDIDYKADAAVARTAEEEGIVLLKNAGNLLPLTAAAKHIAVIGGHADAGVLSGGGSSQVIPAGGPFIQVPMGGEGMMAAFHNAIFDPSSPLKAIRAAAPGAEVRYDDGRYLSTATATAKWADVVIVFATQWLTEGEDAPDLTLPDMQDVLIAAIAKANPHTVVVLETGNPVTMPWLDNVGAVLEAWYPGSGGGEAIAGVLFGATDPSGHLPLTFPQSIDQNPRPKMPGANLPPMTPFDVDYSEGADVGYRWFAKEDIAPLFPFGFGLSYTSFDYANLTVTGGQTLTVGFDVTNTGGAAGAAVPQVYLTARGGQELERLIGFARVTLKPGETQHVSVTADPRLLADFDTAAHGWRIAPGAYDVAVSRSAATPVLTGSATLDGALLQP